MNERQENIAKHFNYDSHSLQKDSKHIHLLQSAYEAEGIAQHGNMVFCPEVSSSL